MSKVVITGWQYGFKKISMTRLIRAYTGYDLAEGKHCTDKIMEKPPVILDKFTAEQCEKFVVEARELGAVCHVETVEPVMAARS